MRSFRKVKAVPLNEKEANLVPYEMFQQQQSGGNIDVSEPVKQGNAIRRHALDKQKKLLMVILQLAKNNAYSDELKIRLKNGSLLEPNQFINLLNYALSPGKALAGVDDFVEILFESKVTPEMLINENVKVLLRQLYARRKPSTFSYSATPSQSYVPPPQPRVDEDRGSDITRRDVPYRPDVDFDDPLDLPPSAPSVKRKAVHIEEPSDNSSRFPKRVRSQPDRLQVGNGWEDYDSDDEV